MDRFDSEQLGLWDPASPDSKCVRPVGQASRFEKIGPGFWRGMGFRLIDYLGGLEVTQGHHAGQPFEVLDWQRSFLIGAFDPGVSDAALTVARGNGKTALLAGVALAAVDGPLRVERAETIIVAGSSDQAALLFEDCLAYAGPRIASRVFRVQDSAQKRAITHRPSGARVRVISSDPKRAHGLRPILILADEPAQWEPGSADKMLAALRTSRGKITGSRFVALGTRPGLNVHWFARMLARTDGRIYVQSHAADDLEAGGDREQWALANPSLGHMPELERTIASEWKDAEDDPALLSSFRALRLNGGVSEVDNRDLVVMPHVWRRCVTGAEAAPDGATAWGIDLGSAHALSAIACVWETGRLETLAMFGADPTLEERAAQDGTGELYPLAVQEGELLVSPKRIPDVAALMAEAARRWGMPRRVACDRWRIDELRDALDGDGLPWKRAQLIPRGQGFKDGGQAILAWRKATVSGRLRPAGHCRLLTWQLAEAVTVCDVAGNEKLARDAEGGRRKRLRDDVVAAALLAVEFGLPPEGEPRKARPAFRIVG